MTGVCTAPALYSARTGCQPTKAETSLRGKAFIWDQRIAIQGAQIQVESQIVSPSQERGLGFLWEKRLEAEVSCIKKGSLVLHKLRLGLSFVDWLEIRSSGKRLDSYSIDWLAVRPSAKFSFISPYKQDILVLTDFLECWQFGTVWTIKKTTFKAMPLQWLLWLYFNMAPLTLSFTQRIGDGIKIYSGNKIGRSWRLDVEREGKGRGSLSHLAWTTGCW